MFMRKHYEQEAALWPEVKRELFWAASLVCLIRRDLAADWSESVHATDASLQGRGIVSTERKKEDVKALGKRSDRWRFSDSGERDHSSRPSAGGCGGLEVSCLRPVKCWCWRPHGSAFGKIGVKLTGPCGSDPGQSPSSREGRWSGYSNIWLGPRKISGRNTLFFRIPCGPTRSTCQSQMCPSWTTPWPTSSTRCSSTARTPLLAATKFYRTDVDKMNIPGQGQGCNEGVPEARAAPREATTPMANVMRDRPECLGRERSSGDVVAHHLGNSLPPRGSPQTQAPRCGASFEDERQLDHHPELTETPGPIHDRGEQRRRQARAQSQGGGKRRGRDRGSALHGRLRRDADNLPGGQGAPQDSVRFPLAPRHHPIQQGGVRPAVCQPRNQLCAPAAPRKRVDRCAQWPAHTHRGAETRPLVRDQVSAAVQQRGPCGTGLYTSLSADQKKAALSAEVDRKDFRRCRRVQGLGIGLEIFSGSGHFSKAIQQRLKQVLCVEVDTCHGPQFDLTLPRIQKEIFDLLLTNRVKYVWLGTPCSSWSRARRHDGKGPGPLRDDHEFLLGLPGLSDKDKLKVKVCNSLMKFSAKVFRMCVDLGIPVALENPHTSRLWLAPPIRHLLYISHKSTECGYTDFCQDFKPFRQRTRLLWAHVNLGAALRHCVGKHGLCSCTGVRHQQLAGTEGGQFRTSLAQPYPMGPGSTF